MNTSAFWNVIADYNQHTFFIQVIFLTFIIISILLAYIKKIYFMPKIALGISCLFIGIVFFLYYGTEPIQTYFAAPLFMPCPMISLCILFYSCYTKRNRLLMLLLIIWGMTGIKSIFFHVYEDLILLTCGFYGLYFILETKFKHTEL